MYTFTHNDTPIYTLTRLQDSPSPAITFLVWPRDANGSVVSGVECAVRVEGAGRTLTPTITKQANGAFRYVVQHRFTFVFLFFSLHFVFKYHHKAGKRRIEVRSERHLASFSVFSLLFSSITGAM
jgi:hypothetical protein